MGQSQDRCDYPAVFPKLLKSSSECDIWEQGEDITCKLSNSTGPVLNIPSGFNPALPVKIVIHGFADDIKLRSEAVPRYMDKFKGEVNVILVNWQEFSTLVWTIWTTVFTTVLQGTL